MVWFYIFHTLWFMYSLLFMSGAGTASIKIPLCICFIPFQYCLCSFPNADASPSNSYRYRFLYSFSQFRIRFFGPHLFDHIFVFLLSCEHEMNETEETRFFCYSSKYNIIFRLRTHN